MEKHHNQGMEVKPGDDDGGLGRRRTEIIPPSPHAHLIVWGARGWQPSTMSLLGTLKPGKRRGRSRSKTQSFVFPRHRTWGLTVAQVPLPQMGISHHVSLLVEKLAV